MFGQGAVPSEEEKKAQTAASNQTLQQALVIGSALFIIPSIIHFIQKRMN
ncbi:hypothetical protein DASC09_030870 [Saccharomycopsis crataegensis]|uniref:Mitochondrial import receptor subunit TOM5 n=1 Tax=Saccharomycopsis crataegensis TaxID=43959 RepID=A0AAV5QMC2_9ASCO|nr:hypothetical protein DASC09_030870 [Saccharomycopsis crataegensis]